LSRGRYGNLPYLTEVGARWSDEGVERVARLLEEVRLNGTRLEF